ncbi:MAG: hypothetical protein EOO73_12595 [Myxococcales bacterium]|nr:MAG: hypothetical protein EOO73_12595 [Myxococcales bacterium]
MRAKLSLAALALFCVAMLAGALTYPGGSWLHPRSTGFSIVENFWCDLMRRPAHNGAPNPFAPWLGTLGFAAMGAALAPFWLEVSRLLPARRAQFVRGAGVVSAVCTALVALFPSDRFPHLHPPIVISAGTLGFACGVLTGGFALAQRRRFPVFAYASFALLLAASANLVLYVRAVYFRAAETLALPVAQKLATLGLLVWMVAGLRASASRPKP